MPERPATLRDVAAAARVHPATASRALNPETRILVSEDTARRVTDAAARLGYRPNPVARSLRTRRSHTVGVLIPDLNNPLFPPIVRGLEDKLAAAGYVALIGNTDADASRERTLFEQMRARHVDGFVLATATLHDQLLAEAAAAEVPLVLMNRLAQDYSFPSVSVDNEQGARMAVTHLARLGHTRIAHVAGPQEASTGVSRLRGFRDGMATHGLEVDEGLIAYATRYTVEEGRPLLPGTAGPAAGLHRGGRRQRHAGGGLLRGARRALPAVSRGHLGDRLQRHAVHRPAAAAAHHGPLPALPAGHRGGAAAARAHQRERGTGEDPLPRAGARRPRVHVGTSRATGRFRSRRTPGRRSARRSRCVPLPPAPARPAPARRARRPRARLRRDPLRPAGPRRAGRAAPRPGSPAPAASSAPVRPRAQQSIAKGRAIR